MTKNVNKGLTTSALTAAAKAYANGEPHALMGVNKDGKPTSVRHPDGRNLYLSVSPVGAMSWVFMWKQNGKRQEMGLGSFTGAGRAVRLSLSEARLKADEVRVMLSKGINPLNSKRAVKTFEQMQTEYLKSVRQAKGWKSDREDGDSETERKWTASMQAHAPSILKMRVADVTRDDIVAVLKPKWGSPVMEAVRRQIEKVLSAAMGEKLRTDNPAIWKGNLDSTLHSKPTTQNNHASMSDEDLPPFFAQLMAIDSTVARSLAFLILTGTRRDEAREMKRSEVDLKHVDGPRWTVPAARVKTSRKKGVGNGAEHIVPLSSTMVAILQAQPVIVGNDYVWGGDAAGRPIASASYGRLMISMGVKGEADEDGIVRSEATPHGFRSTFSDWIGEHPVFGLDVETREFALAHSLNAVTGAYRRKTAVERRRVMMQAWDDFCCGKSNVVPMAKAA